MKRVHVTIKFTVRTVKEAQNLIEQIKQALRDLPVHQRGDAEASILNLPKDRERRLDNNRIIRESLDW